MDGSEETWIARIANTLRDLGGEASLSDIYKAFEHRSNRALPKTFADSIRRTMQDHSSSARYRQTPNAAVMFAPIGRYRSGRWRLVEPYLSDPKEIDAFEVVVDPDQVDDLQISLIRSVAANSVRRRIDIGMPGSPVVTRLAYVTRDLTTWAVLADADTRWWNAFGYFDPSRTQPVVVEVNPSRTGRKTGGAFVRERATGTTFLAWRGLMGGTFAGRASEFWAAYDGPEVQVARKTALDRYAVACAVTTGDPMPNITAFTARVGSAKRKMRNEAGSGIPTEPKSALQSEEYDGEAEYRRNGYVRYVRRHGRVVNALLRILKDQGATRTVNNDVQILPDGVLFEVKTEADTTSLFTAVGQLIINGRLAPKRPFKKLVLVIPERVAYPCEAFESIGIDLVTFRYRLDNEPEFSPKLAVVMEWIRTS